MTKTQSTALTVFAVSAVFVSYFAHYFAESVVATFLKILEIGVSA